jgi:hypothetical protein
LHQRLQHAHHHVVVHRQAEHNQLPRLLLGHVHVQRQQRLLLAVVHGGGLGARGGRLRCLLLQHRRLRKKKGETGGGGAHLAKKQTLGHHPRS